MAETVEQVSAEIKSEIEVVDVVEGQLPRQAELPSTTETDERSKGSTNDPSMDYANEIPEKSAEDQFANEEMREAEQEHDSYSTQSSHIIDSHDESSPSSSATEHNIDLEDDYGTFVESSNIQNSLSLEWVVGMNKDIVGGVHNLSDDTRKVSKTFDIAKLGDILLIDTTHYSTYSVGIVLCIWTHWSYF